MKFEIGYIVSLAVTIGVTYFLVRLVFDIFIGGRKEGFETGVPTDILNWDGKTLTLSGNVVVTGDVTVPKLNITTKPTSGSPRWTILSTGDDDTYLTFNDNTSPPNRYAMFGNAYKNL